MSSLADGMAPLEIQATFPQSSDLSVRAALSYTAAIHAWILLLRPDEAGLRPLRDPYRE